MQNQIKRDARGLPRDHRRIAEGLLNYVLKIRKLRLFMDGLRNALISKRYVIATKKAQRRHKEGEENT